MKWLKNWIARRKVPVPAVGQVWRDAGGIRLTVKRWATGTSGYVMVDFACVDYPNTGECRIAPSMPELRQVLMRDGWRCEAK